MNTSSNKKYRRSAVAKQRSKNATCPACSRQNAFFKATDDDDVSVRKCRYCGYFRVFDKHTHLFYD
jgi:Zn ribbon nucleic-acid-binding protein